MLKNSRKGFTLIELLIVMAIISVLASILITSFRSSQARARDVARKNDLKEVANALELYYSDYNKYPNTLNWGTEFTDGKTTYFKVLPKDPVDSQYYFYRIVDSPSNQKFQLFTHLENDQDQSIITTPYTCGSISGTMCNFSITSSNTTPTE